MSRFSTYACFIFLLAGLEVTVCSISEVWVFFTPQKMQWMSTLYMYSKTTYTACHKYSNNMCRLSSNIVNITVVTARNGL